MTDAERDPLAWETLGGAVEYRCPGFAVRRDDVRLPDGTETTYHYASEPEAVVVLPFTPDGDVVLIEEWRQAVGRVNRGLPAGSVEPEEDPAVAAHRELGEETGHEADALARLCTVEPTNGLADSVHHHFVARGCRPAAGQALDADESIRPVVAPYPDFRDAVLAGDVRDGRAVLAVCRYELADDLPFDDPAPADPTLHDPASDALPSDGPASDDPTSDAG